MRHRGHCTLWEIFYVSGIQLNHWPVYLHIFLKAKQVMKDMKVIQMKIERQGDGRNHDIVVGELPRRILKKQSKRDRIC